MTDPSEVLQQYAFHTEPVIEHDGDSWTARYPHQDWSVSAPSEDEALQKLKDEFVRRQNAGEPGYTYADTVFLRHLQEPVPGVYAMPNEVYLQLFHQNAAQADVRRAFKEAEEKRLAGEPYTLDDYLRGKG